MFWDPHKSSKIELTRKASAAFKENFQDQSLVIKVYF